MFTARIGRMAIAAIGIVLFGAATIDAQEKGKHDDKKAKPRSAPAKEQDKKRGAPASRPNDIQKRDDAPKGESKKDAAAEEKRREEEKKRDEEEARKKEEREEKEARERDGEKVPLDDEDNAKNGSAKALESESRKHAERLAKLDRLKEVALETQNQKLLENVEKMAAQEKDRHANALARIAEGPKKGDAKKPNEKKDVAPKEPKSKRGDDAKPKDKKSGDDDRRDKKPDVSKRGKEAPASAPKDKKPANPKKD